MLIGDQEFETKQVVSAFFILAITLVLPLTVFIFNQRQTTQQQAASTNAYDFPAGCPATNPDRSTNSCSESVFCPDNEYIKWDGNAECEEKLGKPSYCCSTSIKLAP